MYLPYFLTNINMQSKTVRSPLHLTIVFMVLIPIIAFCMGRLSVDASTLREKYCDNQFNQSFVYKISPLAYQRCWKIFAIKTEQWRSGNY